MQDNDDLPKKSILRRLEYIEFLLRFRGWIARADLVNKFDIGEAVATRDIRHYRNKAPSNLELNQKTKKYEILEESFQPLFPIAAQKALSLLKRSSISSSLFGPEAEGGLISPPRLTYPNIDFLAKITRAIATKSYLNTTYTSIKNGESQKRLLPHGLFDNGIHWYVRAYDADKKQHRSYALTRFLSIALGEKQDKDAYELISCRDHQWNHVITLELMPHPNRDFVKNPETIEHDFGMTDGHLKVDVRAIVAGYWLNMWNVDCSADHSLKEIHYLLWLRNHPALFGVDGRNIAPGYSDKFYVNK